ncbi:MAG: TSUP family transporter [Iamia sp.]
MRWSWCRRAAVRRGQQRRRGRIADPVPGPARTGMSTLSASGALGVIILGVLGLTVHDTLRRLNAGKGLLSLVDASVSVVVFGFFGPVQWAFVAVAAPSTLLGGFVGAKVASRLDERVLRASVVTFGVAVSIYLLVRAL